MNKRHYIIPIFVPHEGCTHECVFCNQNSITGIDTTVTVEFVENTIEDYLKTINKTENTTVEVSFFGGSFTAISECKQKSFLKIAKKYKDQKRIDYIRLSTRPDCINEHILDYLEEYGVNIIELGIQSLDETVLKKSARGHVANDSINSCKLIKARGFKLGVQVMLGLPGDTKEKDIYTALELCKYNPDMARIYPALVLKDTPMEKMHINNIYKPYTLEEAVEIGKLVYSIFIKNNINVIRVGLQSTDNINVDGDIIDGPFHPAFRELVESSLYWSMIDEYIRQNEQYDKIEIEVNSVVISKIYADKKRYLKKYLEKNNTKIIRVSVNNDVEKDKIMIKIGNKELQLSFNEYICKNVFKGNDIQI